MSAQYADRFPKQEGDMVMRRAPHDNISDTKGMCPKQSANSCYLPAGPSSGARTLWVAQGLQG